MNYENLVNLIVEEIYKKINNEQVEISNKPKAVILFEQDDSKIDLLREDFDIKRFDSSTRDCDIVIVSRLCMRGLANLASGNSASIEEGFILRMLMKGKRVYVLDDGIQYKRYKENAPKALYKKFMSFEDEICKFGVEVVKDLKSITTNKQSIKKEAINKEEPKLENKIINKINLNDIEKADELSLDLRNKKLISESDLRKPMLNGIENVIVNKKSIITPLAVDFMRIHHLKLKKM